MPNTKSAEKALRSSLRKKTQNLKRKDTYKNTIKKLRKVDSAKDKEKAEKLLKELYKAVDKAGKTNAIKWGKADRIKSRAASFLLKKISA